jgi:hypothetical protein
MNDRVVDVLILDLLKWLARRDRSREEVMEAWRTSCPKLPAWEEANDRGLVEREEAGGSSVVKVSAAGRALLEYNRPRQGRGHDVAAHSVWNWHFEPGAALRKYE